MVAFERNLHPQHLPEEVALVTPASVADKNLTEDDPAEKVMTDLTRVTPFTIEGSASLDNINSKMIACGVRLLFVVNDQNNLIGLVTATDILGEKPLLYVTHNGGTREDIMARDIMTPVSQLEGIPLLQLAHARVADIISALKECQRHHMLVLENRDGKEHIRGIISITQVGRQLGIDITPSLRAQGFAEILKALG